MKQARSSYRLTQTILKNLAKPRPERTEVEVEVFRGFDGEPMQTQSHEACAECGRAKSEFVEGPVLRCLRCQRALCFLCTGAHLDCRNRCEEAK